MDPIEPTGGTSGEPTPSAPVADGSPNLADEIIKDLNSSPPPPPAEPAKTGLSADVLKQLEGINPEELPHELRMRLEKPFLSQYGKKTTEWDRERSTYLEAIEKLAQRLDANGQVPQDTRAKVSELMANGDYEAAVGLLRDEWKQEITPERQFITTQIAINEAKHLMPDLAKYEQMVAEGVKSDPILAEMTNVNNRRYAGRVLAGLAFQAENVQLKAQLKELGASFEAKVRQAIDETQRRIKGLPPSTSRAGSTPSATPASKPATLLEAMEAAYAEQRGA